MLGEAGNPGPVSSSTTDQGWLEIRAYCICGGSFRARSEPPAAAEHAHELWHRIHLGTGHEACDQRTAARARAKARKAQRVA